MKMWQTQESGQHLWHSKFRRGGRIIHYEPICTAVWYDLCRHGNKCQGSKAVVPFATSQDNDIDITMDTIREAAGDATVLGDLL